MNLKNVVKFGLKWNEAHGALSEIHTLNDRIWKHFPLFFLLHAYGQLCRINRSKTALSS